MRRRSRSPAMRTSKELSNGYRPGSGDYRDSKRWKGQAETYANARVEKRVGPHATTELTVKDYKALALLVCLYLLQGVPLGLTLGSLPYLLQPRVSYASIGLFSLAGYPYSLKLLWSPIVDACYSERWGRRKSWILPVQGCVGLALLFIGSHVDHWVSTAEFSLRTLTVSFFSLVLLCATQDIAVDGWHSLLV